MLDLGRTLLLQIFYPLCAALPGLFINFQKQNGSRESRPENSHALLTWEVSISSFYFSSPPDLVLLLLRSLFSLMTLFLSSLSSPFAALSWAGRKWLPCLWILRD